MCTISAFMAASRPLTVAAPTISAFIAAPSPLMSGYSNSAFVAAPSPLVSGCIDSPFTSLHQTLTILIVLLLLAHPNIQHIFFSLIYSLRIFFLYIYPSSFFFYNRHWLTHICRLTQTLCIHAPIHTHTHLHIHTCLTPHAYGPHSLRPPRGVVWKLQWFTLLMLTGENKLVSLFTTTFCHPTCYPFLYPLLFACTALYIAAF